MAEVDCLPNDDRYFERCFFTVTFVLYLHRQYQQRMPYELLSGLANCLLNETIFKIVEGLTEIQQVTEKQLLQQRLKLLHRHRGNKTYSTYISSELNVMLLYLQLKKKLWQKDHLILYQT